ncbi:hypothetical protein ACFWUQ_25960 [Streptomyces sp. NPDC058662]|uniref:hypothetical protein n=1 Tax=Streptomyces sp. NPDC058662 TaxID=3346583 RepID=UPI00365A9882
MGTPPRTSLRRAAASTLFAAFTVTGCSPSASAPPTGSHAPAPAPAPPARICTTLVSYWARETLLGTTWSGLDWEQKGLSNAQYAIHEDAVAAGRAEEATAGRAKALELIDRYVARRCAEEDGATGRAAAPSPAE